MGTTVARRGAQGVTREEVQAAGAVTAPAAAQDLVSSISAALAVGPALRPRKLTEPLERQGEIAFVN